MVYGYAVAGMGPIAQVSTGRRRSRECGTERYVNRSLGQAKKSICIQHWASSPKDGSYRSHTSSDSRSLVTTFFSLLTQGVKQTQRPRSKRCSPGKPVPPERAQQAPRHPQALSHGKRSRACHRCDHCCRGWLGLGGKLGLVKKRGKKRCCYFGSMYGGNSKHILTSGGQSFQQSVPQKKLCENGCQWIHSHPSYPFAFGLPNWGE